tara:strand:- start:128 stop:274 length:147 start_codon:yes stop_codon:yes gene_type:complete
VAHWLHAVHLLKVPAVNGAVLAAAIAAPDWVKDALTTINELEERIEAQ